MKRNKRFIGVFGVLLCAAVLISTCTACSSSDSKTATTENKSVAQHSTNTAPAAAAQGIADTQLKDGTTATDREYGAAQTTGTTAAAAAALTNQKIIQNLSYQIETLKFDDSAKTIQSLCTELGGYMQDSSVSGRGIMKNQGNLRSANYVLRIPQGKLDQFKNSAGNIGNVLNFISSSENVSEKYFDTEARLKSLRTQQERLMALLEKSGALKDVIELEKALADVNYQIEQFTGTLRQYDSLIGFSTVSIQLNEVVKPTELENIPVTLGDRIARQFKDSMRSLGRFGEGLLVFFIGGAPIILLLAAIAAVIIFIVWKRKKRSNKKSEEFMALRTPSEIKPEKDEEHPEK